MNIQNKNVHDDFNTFFTTLIFVLLNIGTCGIYGFYWIISASITANKKYVNGSPTKSTFIVVFLVLLGLIKWLDIAGYGAELSCLEAAIEGDREQFRAASDDLTHINAVVCLLGLAFAVAVGILGKDLFTKAFAKDNLKFNIIWSILFNIAYFYYVIRNYEAQVMKSNAVAAPAPAQPQEDLETKLTKLKALKDKGLITEEEYEAKKKSILES